MESTRRKKGSRFSLVSLRTSDGRELLREKPVFDAYVAVLEEAATDMDVMMPFLCIMPDEVSLVFERMTEYSIRSFLELTQAMLIKDLGKIRRRSGKPYLCGERFFEEDSGIVPLDSAEKCEFALLRMMGKRRAWEKRNNKRLDERYCLYKTNRRQRDVRGSGL